MDQGTIKFKNALIFYKKNVKTVFKLQVISLSFGYKMCHLDINHVLFELLSVNIWTFSTLHIIDVFQSSTLFISP